FKEDAIEENVWGVEREDFESEVEFETEILKNHVENLHISLNNSLGSVPLEDFDFDGNVYSFTYYVVSNWGSGGNNYQNGKNDWNNCFRTEEQAEDSLFQRVVNYDFSKDVNRDSYYSYYREE